MGSYRVTKTAGVSLLPVSGCGSIDRLNCDRTSATDNSNDNSSGVTDHNAS